MVTNVFKNYEFKYNLFEIIGVCHMINMVLMGNGNRGMKIKTLFLSSFH